MILVQTTTPQPATGSVHLEEDRPRQIKAYGEVADKGIDIPFRDLLTFVLEGGTTVRLKAPLIVRLTGAQIEVLGWGLHFSNMELANIDSHVKRHFLRLYGKAERGELNEDEHQTWMHIVDAIDYQRFCAERARPFYVEGTVRKINDERAVLVEWQDRETEWVPANIASALGALHTGDVFSAFVKRNHLDHTTRIETVSFLGERGLVYAEMPADWPPVLQVAEGEAR